jgi:hypothetical protein
MAVTKEESIFPNIHLPGGISSKATEYKELARKGDKWESPVFSIGSAQKSTDIPSAPKIEKKPHHATDPHAPGTGYTNGNSNGYTNGHTNGHSNGYTNGHSNGYTNGRTNGPGNGYTTGQPNLAPGSGLTAGQPNLGPGNGYTSGQQQQQPILGQAGTTVLPSLDINQGLSSGQPPVSGRTDEYGARRGTTNAY